MPRFVAWDVWMDITGLLYGTSPPDEQTPCPPGYDIRTVSTRELAELVSAGLAPESLADLLPKSASKLGLQLAQDVPGLRIPD